MASRPIGSHHETRHGAHGMAREIEYVVPMTARFSDGSENALVGHIATGFLDRFMGLMGQESVPEWRGLLFPRCTSLHTYWMRVPIDVLWLGCPEPDGTMLVIGSEHSLPPSRCAFAPKGTWGAAEFAAGTFTTLPVTVTIEGMDTRGRVAGS